MARDSIHQAVHYCGAIASVTATFGEEVIYSL
jgi:hypothetical protein